MNFLQVLHCSSRFAANRCNSLNIRCLSLTQQVANPMKITVKNGVFVKKRKSPRKCLAGPLIKELDFTNYQLGKFYELGAPKELDKISLNNQIITLKKMGFEIEDIKSEIPVLLVSKEELVMRKEILEECGVENITTRLLSRYETVVRSRVGLLKAAGTLPQEVNVPEKILSFCGEDIPPPNFSALRKTRYSSSSATADSIPLSDVHKYTILHYMAWYLNDPKVFKIRRRYKPKSLRHLMKAIDALQSINVPKEKLLNCIYPALCDAENLHNLLKVFPKIGGREMAEIIQKHPKIAMRTPEDIKAALGCIKKFGFTEEAVAVYPEVLTFRVEYLRQGLSLLQSIPDLWALRHNGNILRLLSQNDLVPKLQYFKSLNREVAPTVPLLSGCSSAISRNLQRESSRQRVVEFLTFLAKELGSNKEDVKAILSRHPGWRQGSTTVMSETLTLLRSQGFKNDNILQNLQILLYPRSHVEVMLEKRIGAKAPTNLDLALCLYDIEKELGFSGSGVINQKNGTEKCDETGKSSTDTLRELGLHVDQSGSRGGKKVACTDEPSAR